MRAMMSVLLMVIVGALVWTARPATAGDEDKARIAELEAVVARLEAETTHLREAYKLSTQNASVATRTLTALSNSLKAAREVTAALTTQRDQLQREVGQLRGDIVRLPSDDPVRLRLALRDSQDHHTTDITLMQKSINKWTALAGGRAVRMITAESELAAYKVKLAKAAATIERLRAVK